MALSSILGYIHTPLFFLASFLTFLSSHVLHFTFWKLDLGMKMHGHVVNRCFIVSETYSNTSFIFVWHISTFFVFFYPFMPIILESGTVRMTPILLSVINNLHSSLKMVLTKFWYYHCLLVNVFLFQSNLSFPCHVKYLGK